MAERIFRATRTGIDAARRAAGIAMLCFAAGGCSPQSAVDVSHIEIVAFGIMHRAAARYRPDDTSSIGAPIGQASDMRIVERTDRIPFRLGLAYGVAFVVRGTPPGAPVEVKVVLTSSSRCVLKSTGEVVHRNESVLPTRIGDLRHIGVAITAGEENPCRETPGPGTETIELYHGARKLARQTFELYRAE